MIQQQTVMKYDPATGQSTPYPSHAQQWRDWNGNSVAWIFNPWTGRIRTAEDIGSDLQGLLIIPPGEAICAG